MAKLALHFREGGVPRVLDTEAPGGQKVWRVGRDPNYEVVFRHPMVSVNHARIAFEPNLEVWQLADKQSTNGTWLNGQRMKPEKWENLMEGDTADFGHPEARIRFSYDTDETLRQAWDDTPTQARSSDEQEESDDPAVPWWGRYIGQAWEWLSTPKTPAGAVYRWVILFTSGLLLALILYLWKS